MLKNDTKLQHITQKISELTAKKKAIESAYAENLAKKITKLLLKKNLLRRNTLSFDAPRLLSALEKALEAGDGERGAEI